EDAVAIDDLGAPAGPYLAVAEDLGRDVEDGAHRWMSSCADLGCPHEPGEAPLAVPCPIKAERLRVLPGSVLRVSQEAGRPEPTRRTRLVEPDAVADVERLGAHRAGPEPAAGCWPVASPEPGRLPARASRPSIETSRTPARGIVCRASRT